MYIGGEKDSGTVDVCLSTSPRTPTPSFPHRGACGHSTRICGGCRAEPDLSCPLTEGEDPLPALSGRLVPTTGAGLADERDNGHIWSRVPGAAQGPLLSTTRIRPNELEVVNNASGPSGGPGGLLRPCAVAAFHH